MTCEREVVFTLSLPRSRTAWLANLFSSEAHAMHEPLSELCTVDALARHVAALPEGLVFIADTGAAVFVDDIVRSFPRARFIVATRAPREVMRSLRAMGLSLDGFDLMTRAFDRAKDVVRTRDRECFHLPVESLDEQGVVDAMWAWAFDNCIPFDAARYRMLRDFRVEGITERMLERIRPEAVAQAAKAMTRI